MDDTTRSVDAAGRPLNAAADNQADTFETDAATDRRTEEIRSEIEHTREEMAETIDAIQEKLRPRNIVANATERVKTATTERVRAMADMAGDTAQTVVSRTRESAGGLMDTIRENPIPAAMIGVGAAWLFSSAAGSSNRSRGSNGYSYGDSYGDEYGAGRSLRRTRGYAYGSEASRTSGWREQASESTEDLTARAKEYVGETTDTLRRTSRRAQNQFQRMMTENPLLVGAGALMLGAAFGLAVPETDRENELMGETRDTLVDRAQQMAGDAASKLQETASNVADTAGKVADTMTSKPQGT